MPRFGPNNLASFNTWESVKNTLEVSHLSRTTKTSGVPEVPAAEHKKRSDDAKNVLNEIDDTLKSHLSVRDFNIVQNLRGQLKELLGLNKTKQTTEATLDA